jgi:hypothetical protein
VLSPRAYILGFVAILSRQGLAPDRYKPSKPRT